MGTFPGRARKIGAGITILIVNTYTFYLNFDDHLLLGGENYKKNASTGALDDYWVPLAEPDEPWDLPEVPLL